MARLAEGERTLIAEAAHELREKRPGLAKALRKMLEGPPTLTVEEVGSALAEWFGSSVAWTRFNTASKYAAEHLDAWTSREAVFFELVRHEALPNCRLHDLLAPRWGSYTAERRITEMKRRGLVIDGGTVKVAGRGMWTLRKLAPAVRDFLNPDPQGSFL